MLHVPVVMDPVASREAVWATGSGWRLLTPQADFQMTNFGLSLVTVFPTSATCAFLGVPFVWLPKHSACLLSSGSVEASGTEKYGDPQGIGEGLIPIRK